MAKATRRIPARPKRPTFNHVLTAMQYWDLLNNISLYFDGAEMPVVKNHLDAACAEIDRIWMENDFDGSKA